MSSFRDSSWSSRFSALGDMAEGAFEQYATDTLKLNFERFGLNRPQLRVASLPSRVRHAPDYLMTNNFVEVVGFGKDQTMKLGLEKYGALHWWNDLKTKTFDGVQMFVWDSKNERGTMFPFLFLDDLLAEGKGGLDSFPEKKAYFSFRAEDLFA